MSQQTLTEWVQQVARATSSLIGQTPQYRWLLRQSLMSHFQRLLTLKSLGRIDGPILDIGAGTGAMTLDLAWRYGESSGITAIDNDPGVLVILDKLAKHLKVNIDVMSGDVAALPVQTASQSATIARYVFQHLSDPRSGLQEMCRVTRPGGQILIIDVDDGMSLGDPPEPAPLAALREAERQYQQKEGGNRCIGRQLYRMMRKVGLESIQTTLIPRVWLGLQQGRDPGIEQHQVERFQARREALVEHKLITAETFEAGIRALQSRFGQDRFELEADFIALGQMPEKG
ncbi:class I SAM-dependent methyltransferase [Acidihalobacter prosperus]